MVKLVPLDAETTVAPKRLGFLAGEVQVPDDFDNTSAAEIEWMFGVVR